MSNGFNDNLPAEFCGNERKFVFEVLCSMFPRLTPLAREIVGQNGSLVYWENVVSQTLWAEARIARSEAMELRVVDAKRGIPNEVTFKLADELRAKAEKFESRVAEIRTEAITANFARAAAQYVAEAK